MKRLFGALLVSSAAFLFYSSEPGSSWDLGSLRKTSAAPKASADLPASGAVPAPSADPVGPGEAPGFSDFDAFNNLNDPLYREGSKALLRKAVELEEGAAARAGKRRPGLSTLRDAPADFPAKTAEPARPDPGANAPQSRSFSGRSRLIKVVPSYPSGS